MGMEGKSYLYKDMIDHNTRNIGNWQDLGGSTEIQSQQGEKCHFSHWDVKHEVPTLPTNLE